MLIKRITFLIIAVLILFGGNLFAQGGADRKTARELVGVWHASPYVASEMNDHFQFFADGRFRFNFNGMILSKRTVSFSGRWKVSGRKLILTVSEKTVIEGGRKVESEISADGFEIEGGRRVSKRVVPAEKQTRILSAVEQDEIYKMISIGGVKYWKLSDDPEAYEN
jgi:hypothetical protein